MSSLHVIARDLRRGLVAIGRDDLALRALDDVRFTDDGTTVYVHIYKQPAWRSYRAGDVYPLALADHPDLQRLGDWRALLREARLLLDDDFARIVTWLDG